MILQLSQCFRSCHVLVYSLFMDKSVSFLVHFIIPLFIFHLTEEWVTHFYETDTMIVNISRFVNYSPETTFLFIQIFLFLFLAIILATIIQKKISNTLFFILAMISLYELIHLYDFLNNYSYTPGLITGTSLGIAGLVFLSKLFK